MKINYSNCPYISFIKANRSQVLNFNYSQNLRLFKQNKELKLKIHAKQDHVDFDKIEITSFLESDLALKSSGDTTFLIESIAPQGWQGLNSFSINSIGSKVEHTVILNVSDLPISWDGENTIKITATTSRFGKTKKAVHYFNFIGIYESYLRNKSKIGFLQVTKRDD